MDDKIKKLISESVKKYGDCIVDPSKRVACDAISTGSLKIDIATGIGGVPRGRITEIYGPESSGKTTLCLHTIANAQRNGGVAAYIDAEHALDSTYAKALGVNMDELVVAQPDTAEQTLDLVKDFLQSGLFTFVFVDSVPAMVPKCVLEASMEDQHMGVMARLMSKAMPILAPAAAGTNTGLLFVNQIRSTMGGPYQPTETTSGGKALKFYASMRIKTGVGAKTKDGADTTGTLIKVTVVKSKVSQPFREADPEIEFGIGFAKTREIISLATDLKIVEKAGSWYSYNNERLGQGLPNSADFLDLNLPILNEIESKVREAHGLKS